MMRVLRAGIRGIGLALRALIALAVLGGVLVGLPYVLITWLGWPFPDHIPTLDEVEGFFRWGFTDFRIFYVLAVFTWFFWALFVRDLLIEVIETAIDISAERRGRPRPPRDGGGPLRILAAVLVGAIFGAILIDLARSTFTAPTSEASGAAFAARPATVAVAPLIAQAAPAPRAEALVEPTAQRLPTVNPILSVRTSTAPVAVPDGVYVVCENDNLTTIAQDQLGDANRWREIFVLNRGVPQAEGGALTEPDLIYIGWHLTLPDQTPIAVTAPTPPAATPAAPTPTMPSADIAPPVAVTPPVAVAPAAPTPATASPATQSTPPAVAANNTGAEAHQHADSGISLPSGAWVTLGLAGAVAAAVTVLRLHRRRRARLRWPIALSARPDRLELPTSVTVLESAGRAADTARRLTRGPAALPSPLLPPPPAVTASIGIDAHGEQVSLLNAAAHGLALTGPGAAAAARAVIAAVTSAGTAAFFAHQGHLAMPTALLAELLPAGIPATGLDAWGRNIDGERLHLHDTAEQAVEWFESEMLYRRRLLDMHDKATYADMAADPDSEALGFAVLLIPADPHLAARVHTVAADGPALRMAAVVLGQTTNLPDLDVAADGNITDNGVSAGRLAALTATDLAEILDVLRLANANTDPGHDELPVDDWDTPGEHEAPGTDPAAEPWIPPAPAEPLTEPTVRLAVLGVPTVTTAAGPITTGIREAAKLLLAVLAAYPEGRNLDQLAEAIGKDATASAAAKKTTHTAMNTLRSVLRTHTGLDKQAMFILHEPSRGIYRLDPDLFDVDLWTMRANIAQALDASHDAESLDALRRAIAVYGGAFVTDIDRPWITDHASTYHLDYLNALGRIAEICETDQPENALAALEQALATDDLNEELYQRVMRIQGRLGRPEAVRRTLTLCETRFADLDTEPSEATRRVAARQLAEAAA